MDEGMDLREKQDLPRKEPLPGEGEPDGKDRPANPTWRGLVVAVVAAIVLSVAATLLLGGSYGFAGRTSPGGCGPGSACCPPAGDQAKAGR